MSGDPIPLSVLALDLPAPGGDWLTELRRRKIPILHDDVGRPCVDRRAAAQLLTERRDDEARAREATARNDAAIEARRLSQLVPGIPADQIPAGLTPAMALVATDPDRQRPRRASVLDHALSHDQGIVFHPIHGEP